MDDMSNFKAPRSRSERVLDDVVQLRRENSRLRAALEMSTKALIDESNTVLAEISLLRSATEVARLAYLGWVNQKSDFGQRMARLKDALDATPPKAEE